MADPGDPEAHAHAWKESGLRFARAVLIGVVVGVISFEAARTMEAVREGLHTATQQGRFAFPLNPGATGGGAGLAAGVVAGLWPLPAWQERVWAVVRGLFQGYGVMMLYGGLVPWVVREGKPEPIILLLLVAAASMLWLWPRGRPEHHPGGEQR